ncbi:hypothetical protein BRADI_2g33545v3 [Brachypodium distachyon]|uniref:C2H2-type domain-containing protein n=1 Tax=Brachypodium distachyon TaxID=15368 RepID=A0A2K2DBL0_BRADI|nr:hypothetical protein BRADI_2g33545v3 [Brachypodium distachyon]
MDPLLVGHYVCHRCKKWYQRWEALYGHQSNHHGKKEYYLPRLTLSSVSGGGGCWDEPPRYQPWHVKSAHELDETRCRRASSAPSAAAASAHQRPPSGTWRAPTAASRPPLPAALVVLRHACHLPNHNGKLGCAWLSKRRGQCTARDGGWGGAALGGRVGGMDGARAGMAREENCVAREESMENVHAI